MAAGLSETVLTMADVVEIIDRATLVPATQSA
jgi:hypothetical protein